MPTLVSTARSEPLAMPLMSSDPATSYNELIRQLAAQAPKPYGAIPPLLKKRKKKNKHHRSPPNTDDDTADGHNDKARIRRRMSHVENWVVVDSKESLPDEEELVCKSVCVYRLQSLLTQHVIWLGECLLDIPFC